MKNECCYEKIYEKNIYSIMDVLNIRKDKEIFIKNLKIELEKYIKINDYDVKLEKNCKYYGDVLGNYERDCLCVCLNNVWVLELMLKKGEKFDIDEYEIDYYYLKKN